MKKLVHLKKYVKNNIVYLLIGVILLIIYAVFNGLNVTAIKPVLDYIFVDTGAPVNYHNLNEFITAIKTAISEFFAENSFLYCMFHLSKFKDLITPINQIMEQTESKFLLFFIAILMSILYTFKNIVFYLQKTMFINFRGKVILDLRNSLYEKYLRQSLAFFHDNQVGDAIVRLVNDVSIVNQDLIMALVNVARQAITILVLVRIAVFLNARLFIYSLVIVPIISFLIGILGKKIKKYAKKIQKQFSTIFNNVEEVLNNIRIVKAFAREDYEIENFHKVNEKYFKYWRKANLYRALNVPIGEINSVLTGLVILIIGGTQILDQTSSYTFGDFMAFLMVIFSIMHPLKELGKAYSNMKKAEASLERILEVLNRKSEILNCKNPISKNDFTKKIEFKNVGFSYNGEEQVLENINLELEKGKSIALVGSSGSGKTTLINLITRMYDVTSGEILVDGHNLKDIKLSDLRLLFGTVTQDAYLFSNTIRNNIEYGKKSKDNLEIDKAIEIAYADEFINTLPARLDEELRSKGTNFSGGQKQRLCIARAIIGNPPIIIFDEATSALDTESEQKVQKAIEKATKDRTVIMIAHRLSTVLKADMIVVMDQGKVIATGTHSELLEKSSRYKELYDIQFNSHSEMN